LSGAPGPRLGKGPDRVACCRDNWPRVKHTNNAALRGPVTSAHAWSRGPNIPQTHPQLSFQDPGICKVIEDSPIKFLSGVGAAGFDSLCMHSTTCQKNHPQICNGGRCTGGVQTSIMKEKKNQCRPSRAPTNPSLVRRSKIHLSTAKDHDRLVHRSRQTMKRSAHYLTYSLFRMHCATGVPQGPIVRARAFHRFDEARRSGSLLGKPAGTQNATWKRLSAFFIYIDYPQGIR
jgi:hypothetical protein